MHSTFLLTVAKNATFRKLFTSCPLTKLVAKRLVPGDTWQASRQAIADLLRKDLKATVAFLNDGVRTVAQAEAVVALYTDALDQIAAEGWADDVDVSVDLTALGLLLRDGETIATTHARAIAAKAHQVGTTVTISMENPATVAKTLRVVNALRQDYADVGCTLQANLKRTENDCRVISGGRLRLTKGIYMTAAQATYTDAHDIRLSYVRCLKILMEDDGTPLVATHDPVLTEIAQELAAHTNRGLRDFEFQMLYGIRTIEQERLADLGHLVRVYLPIGQNWYDYVIRRLAESPANLMIFIRSLFTWN